MKKSSLGFFLSFIWQLQKKYYLAPSLTLKRKHYETRT